MRILYLCPDPGVRVDVAGGAGSHVLETIHALRNLGHEVHLLAADGGVSSVEGQRVPRHRWFSTLLSLTGRTTDPPSKAPSPDSLHDRDARQASSPSSPPSPADASGDMLSPVPDNDPSMIRAGIKQRISGFLYGPFRNHLNLLEETTAYRRRFFRKAIHLIREFRPDGVYERYALGHHSVAAHCRDAGIPHILEVNALLAEERSRHEGDSGFRARRRASEERRFLEAHPRVFVVSEALKRAIDPEDSRVTVLPNGVDTAIFRPDIDPGPALARYGLSDPSTGGPVVGPIVGWIGGFGPSRGLEAVLSIAEAVHRQRPDVRFLVAGDGPLMTWAKETSRTAGLEKVVHLTGRVARPDVPGLIAAFDVALAPYPAEGAAYFSPLKIFEYMAAARAIVATDAGQTSDLLADGAGILMAAHEANDWADRIVALLDDPEERRRMGALARDKVVRNHTWEANARRIVAAFFSPERRP